MLLVLWHGKKIANVHSGKRKCKKKTKKTKNKNMAVRDMVRVWCAVWWCVNNTKTIHRKVITSYHNVNLGVRGTKPTQDIRPCLFLDSPHFNAIESLLTLPTLQLILPNLVQVVWAAAMSKPHSSQPPPPTFPQEHRAIPRSEIKSLQRVMCLAPDLLLVRYVWTTLAAYFWCGGVRTVV